MKLKHLLSAKTHTLLMAMFAALLIPCAVQAQTATDGTFNNPEWETLLNPSSTAPLLGWGSAQDTTGGNPLYSRKTSHVFGVGSIILTHRYKTVTYNPSTQGPITGLSYSYDLIAYSNTASEGANVGYAILVAQGANLYRSALDVVTVNNTWRTFSNGCLTASSFINLDPASPKKHPDFSSLGAPIYFGYVTANSATVGTPHTKDSGIDNWSVTINSCCCPGENLVKNGNFAAGNTNFTSQYAFNPATMTGATLPGQYSIVTGAQAAAISPNWVIADHTTCNTNAGQFMVVNGKTTQIGSKSIWKQTIPVIAGKEYRFCANIKNLPQCTFDIKPKIEVKFSTPPNIPPTVVSVTNSACDWQLISATVLPNTNTLTIDIRLDESGLGDGNDLALDDISLQLKPPVNPNLVLVNITATNVSNANYYSVSANPVNLPSGYGYYWEVCELDNQNNCLSTGTHVINPSAWWAPFPCQFDGYYSPFPFPTLGAIPGKFTKSKRYMIRFGAWSDCEAWSESRWILQYNASLKEAAIIPMQQASQGGIPPVSARGQGVSPARR